MLDLLSRAIVLEPELRALDREIFSEISKKTIEKWGDRGKQTVHTLIKVNTGPSVALDRQFGKVHRGLTELANLLGEKKYLYGTNISVADIAVASALGYVGLRFSEDFSWTEKYPSLAKFYLSMMERNSVKATVPVM